MGVKRLASFISDGQSPQRRPWCLQALKHRSNQPHDVTKMTTWRHHARLFDSTATSSQCPSQADERNDSHQLTRCQRRAPRWIRSASPIMAFMSSWWQLLITSLSSCMPNSCTGITLEGPERLADGRWQAAHMASLPMSRLSQAPREPGFSQASEHVQQAQQHRTRASQRWRRAFAAGRAAGMAFLTSSLASTSAPRFTRRRKTSQAPSSATIISVVRPDCVDARVCATETRKDCHALNL